MFGCVCLGRDEDVALGGQSVDVGLELLQLRLVLLLPPHLAHRVQLLQVQRRALLVPAVKKSRTNHPSDAIKKCAHCEHVFMVFVEGLGLRRTAR